MKRNGFTLVELVVAIAVLGVLAVGAITILNPVEQIRKSTDTKKKAELAQFQRALELYYQDAGRYPASSANYRIVVNATTLNWGATWQPYISKIPTDPSPGKSYVYYSPPASNGQTYYLYATLERGAKDPQACNAGSACTSLSGAGFPASNACGGTCNFGVASANVSP